MAGASDVDRALDRFGDELFELANVVGLGRVPEDASEQDWRLAVYVERKLPEDELAEGQRIPDVLEIEEGGETVCIPTRMIEQGIVRLE